MSAKCTNCGADLILKAVPDNPNKEILNGNSGFVPACSNCGSRRYRDDVTTNYKARAEAAEAKLERADEIHAVLCADINLLREENKNLKSSLERVRSITVDEIRKLISEGIDSLQTATSVRNLLTERMEGK